MNYNNCKHYNEIVRVLSENGSLDNVNFKLEEIEGCECKLNEDSICELWCSLVFADDMMPQLGIENAKQTIALLESRTKEISLNIAASSKEPNDSVEEDLIPRVEKDKLGLTNLSLDEQNIQAQLSEIGPSRYSKSYLSTREQIVKAISEMDIETLEPLVEKKLTPTNKRKFISDIEEEFNKFKSTKDTHLIAYAGKCDRNYCHNYCTNGYSFTGNTSKNFLNLVFKEKHSGYLEICKCNDFNVDDVLINKVRRDERQKELDLHEFNNSDIDDLPF